MFAEPKITVLDERFAFEIGDIEIPFGNTDEFRAFRELVTRRRHNVSHEDIREVLDKPHMTADAIRHTIRRTRERLTYGLGTVEFAKRIISLNGYYRFD